MSLGAAIAIYFVMWWTVLFAILPWRVRAQGEDGPVAPGTDEGAPAHPHLLWKALATTMVSGLVFAAFYWAYSTGVVGLDSFPFLPRFEPYV